MRKEPEAPPSAHPSLQSTSEFKKYFGYDKILEEAKFENDVKLNFTKK